MSYRTLKRVLGETSLERKCRFLFGGGLVLLISGSFFLYGKLNTRLIEDQDRERARLLIAPRLLTVHWAAEQRSLTGDGSAAGAFLRALDESTLRAGEDELASSDVESSSETSAGPTTGLATDNDEAPYKWALLSPDGNADATKRPSIQEGYDALREIAQGADSYDHTDRETGEYHYFGAIRAVESCIACHRSELNETDLQVGDVMAVAQITFPSAKSEQMIAKNNAFLLLLAVVTAFIATVAAYAMIRYVIVKPLLHLREVSDAVYRGDLDQRADIQTNDDFEDLSLAFNRMLRHLVQMQEEQKQIMSEQEANMAQVARANLGLYEANRMKNEFLATVTHELRTPLNSILGFSELLTASNTLTERQAKYAGNIDKSGRNLLSLINDILDIAKIEAGKMGRTVSEFDVRDLIDQEVGTIEPLAKKKNISLSKSIDADVPRLKQDRGKIRQIVVNLLSNAVKFTPEGGRVSVSVQRNRGSDGRDMIAIEVTDSGIGIPLEDQGRIFEKFRQAKSHAGDDLAREYEGTGLGLSIVKELCRLLEGEVSLKSEFGKGSTFRIDLPFTVDPVDEFALQSASADRQDDSEPETDTGADESTSNAAALELSGTNGAPVPETSTPADRPSDAQV